MKFSSIETKDFKYPYPIFGLKKEFQDYISKIYSQNGEEGILFEIFKRINDQHKYYVEFGCSDGKLGSNTAYFRIHENWNGLLLDADNDLVLKAKQSGCNNVFTEKITSNNINKIFDFYKVPSNFSLLSIDIDGNDIYVLEILDLEKYSPNVIILEFNPGLPNQFPIRVFESEEFPGIGYQPNGYFGANLIDYYETMELKNYSFVTAIAWNAIFVKNDLFELLEIPKQSKELNIQTYSYGLGFSYWSKIINNHNFVWLSKNKDIK